MSLNPYCSGRWSRTIMKTTIISAQLHVLILIVVEDGHVPVLSASGIVIDGS